MTSINQRGKQNSHSEFVEVVGYADGHDLFIGKNSGEGEIQYYETVNELRHQGGSCGSQPEHLASSYFSQFLKHKYINQLTEQESGKRGYDDSLSLAQYFVKR